MAGRKTRLLRPRTFVYAAMLIGLVVVGSAMVIGRVPFEASVNRAPGSLYNVDVDGYVRNTYLLKVTNNAASSEPVAYEVRIEGLDGAEVVTQDLVLASSQSRIVPLVVRVPPSLGLKDRTIPIRVHVASPDGELVLDATFKTGAEVGAGESI